MKSVFKIFLAFILAGLTFVFLSILFIIGLSMFGDGKPDVKENSILTIDFNTQIVERSFDDAIGSFDFLTQSANSAMGLNQIKNVLKSAKNDDRLTAVYLKFSGLQAGPATLKELRIALEEFKADSNIPIYSYAEVYTQKALYIASVSDSIFIQPSGMIEFAGLSANVAYYKSMFSKIGVKPEIIRGSNNRFEYKLYL